MRVRIQSGESSPADLVIAPAARKNAALVNAYILRDIANESRADDLWFYTAVAVDD